MRGMFVAGAMLLAAQVQAAPVTYSCQLVAGEGQTGMYGHVDQMVLDTEAKLIDLRIANTMGTSLPMNWLFTNRTAIDGSLEEMFMRENSLGEVVAAGLTDGGGYAFRFLNGTLTFATTYTAPPQAFAWQCFK